MRAWLGSIVLIVALAVSPGAQRVDGPTPILPCSARQVTDESPPIHWHAGPIEDAEALDQWCRGVGTPIVEQIAVDPSSLPALDDLVVVTWNAHLAEGRLTELIAALRAGRLTHGQPVRHFVLLLQELFRRGRNVPLFGKDIRSAYAIKARDPESPDAEAYAAGLGLSIIYVPSMRNGPALQEDRGNAIVSTEPLIDPIALELPFERQRRVAVGASVQVRTARGVERLNLLDVHLEPLSAPSSLWIFRNPRRRQVAAVLDLLRTARFAETETAAGTVLGGDFNTIQGGVEEAAYRQARAWATNLVNEDRRPTHHMGRLDYLFFRLADRRQATTERLNERFGSDHYPVLGRISTDDGLH